MRKSNENIFIFAPSIHPIYEITTTVVVTQSLCATLKTTDNERHHSIKNHFTGDKAAYLETSIGGQIDIIFYVTLYNSSFNGLG